MVFTSLHKMITNSNSLAHIWAHRDYISNSSLRAEVEIEGLDDLDDLPPNKAFILTPLQTYLYASVLEDTAAQLHILEECNNPIRVTKAMADMTELLARKYHVPPRTVGDELTDIDPKKLHCMEYKLQKLEDDRKYLKDVLIGTYMDMALSRRFQYLADQVEEVIDRKKFRENLVTDEASNRGLRRDLNRQLRHQRNHVKTACYDTDAVIQELRTRVEDASLNSNIRKRYVENWQQARTEQHLLKINDKESKPLDSIVYYKNRSDQEQRVHTEVELLISISINETLQKVEQWMNKYDRDIEAIDLKIQKKQNQYDDMLKKVDTLEKTLVEHERLMKNWVAFKDEREQARLHREKMNNAALTIQAWWRGLLVRNQLGPYKIVKRRPPPPGPEGGAKKKK